MELKQEKLPYFINRKTLLKSIILSSVFCLQAFLSFAQGINNVWVLGYEFSNGTNGNTIINFDSLPILPYKTDMNLNFRESNASICDRQGNLLFYTNGVKINNNVKQTMLNGDSLNPGGYAITWQNNGLRIAQGQIILPLPEDSNKYYLFHQTVEQVNNTFQPIELLYSIVDMTLDSGRGAVTQKNTNILSDTLVVGDITACKHANGRDWWLVVHRYLSNKFYTFLITKGGIQGPFSQNVGSNFTYGSGGQACFSPNGKRYARYYQIDKLDLFDFDRCSGTFSNWQHADSLTGYGGVAFSPNSKRLYVTTNEVAYQYNLEDSTHMLKDLQTIVAIWDSSHIPNPPFATTFYLALLAPDNKIYISGGNGVPILHVINNPDSIGIACNFAQHAISLPTVNGLTIPNHPNYFLGADSGSVCDTLMLSNSQPLESNKVTSIVSVFPNPVQNYFDINYQIQPFEIAQFIVYNLIGKEKHRIKLIGNNNSKRVFTNDFENGIYFYKFKNQSGKFIVLK